MAHKIVLQRKGPALVATSEIWYDLLMELPQDIDLNVSATRARSIPQLGTYFGTLKYLIEQGPEWIGGTWLSSSEMSDALQLKVGFVRQIKMPGMGEDEFIRVPKSKSFAECSQQEFNKYFNAAQVQLSAWCGFGAVEAYLQYMAERRKGAA